MLNVSRFIVIAIFAPNGNRQSVAVDGFALQNFLHIGGEVKSVVKLFWIFKRDLDGMFGSSAWNFGRGIVDVDGVYPDMELEKIVGFDGNSPTHLVAVLVCVVLCRASAENGKILNGAFKTIVVFIGTIRTGKKCESND